MRKFLQREIFDRVGLVDDDGEALSGGHATCGSRRARTARAGAHPRAARAAAATITNTGDAPHSAPLSEREPELKV